MKKINTLSFIALWCMLLTFSAQAFGQITLSESDFPSVGLTVVTDSVPYPAIMPGAHSNKPQSWDFSSLVKTYPRTIKFVSPSSTKYASAFPGATLADTTYGVSGYTFFILNGSGFFVAGNEQPVNFEYKSQDYVFESEVVFYPPFEQMPFPGKYSITTTGLSRASESYSEAIPTYSVTAERIASGITYWDTLDAFGTLKMPNKKTYDVLRRVHHELDNDTVYMYVQTILGGTWVPASITEFKKTQYSWYSNGLSFPLVQLNMDTTSSTVRSIVWDTTAPAPTGINDISNNYHVLVYPNPAKSEITFNTLENTAEQSLSVYDVTGRLLDKVTVKNNMVTLNTSTYSNGLYIYNLNEAGTGALLDQGKFIIQH